MASQPDSKCKRRCWWSIKVARLEQIRRWQTWRAIEPQRPWQDKQRRRGPPAQAPAQRGTRHSEARKVQLREITHAQSPHQARNRADWERARPEQAQDRVARWLHDPTPRQKSQVGGAKFRYANLQAPNDEYIITVGDLVGPSAQPTHGLIDWQRSGPA